MKKRFVPNKAARRVKKKWITIEVSTELPDRLLKEEILDRLAGSITYFKDDAGKAHGAAEPSLEVLGKECELRIYRFGIHSVTVNTHQ